MLESREEHGTRRMYRQRGCRCDECRAWNAGAFRTYNAKKREETGLSHWQTARPANRRMTTGGACSRCGSALHRSGINDPICAPCRGNLPGTTIPIDAQGRAAIYQRDEWTCQICQEPVDPSAPPNSRWDATLDHIVPRSKGGSHDATNLRLAHRRCNAVRGNRVLEA